jgi:hypothetical protein
MHGTGKYRIKKEENDSIIIFLFFIAVSVPIHSPAPHMRKAARYACFLAPYGANFAYVGAVTASQSDWKHNCICLHASMTQMQSCFQSVVNSNL